MRIGRGALLGRALDLVPGGAARQARLEAQTAAAEFELVQGGAVVTRRLDLLVGSASRGDVLASHSQDAVHRSILRRCDKTCLYVRPSRDAVLLLRF